MEDKDIELRSEQVRKIIGQIPPLLVRSGIGVIGIIMALLLAVAAFVPYPETAECDITLTDIQQGQVSATGELPYACITQVSTGMKAEIELEGYTSKEYGYLHERKGIHHLVGKDVARKDMGINSYASPNKSSSNTSLCTHDE